MVLTSWDRWLRNLNAMSTWRDQRPWARRHRYVPRFEVLEDRVLPATATWINPASGFWEKASNWSGRSGPGGMPGVGDDVVINQPGTITVTFRTGTASINNLTASDDTLDVIGGTLDWTGGTWSGPVNIQSGGTLNISGAADKIKSSTPLTNAGTVTWTGTGTLFGGESSTRPAACSRCRPTPPWT